MKSRKHHGSNSLDLTIPSKVCKEFKINDGDVFILKPIKEQKEGKEVMVLRYECIYSQK
jgi:hypothetical protein